MPRLIILRHGQSEWNQKNLFTGWVDVPLNSVGTEEAVKAGKLLVQEKCLPDIVYTSLLRRSIKTANLALDEADRAWIPVKRAAALNERHYGGLQGKNKAEAAEKFGDDQVKLWRRSYDTQPPPTTAEDEKQFATPDDRYEKAGIAVPKTECLKDVLERVLPYWKAEIVPDLQAGKTVLIAAHGNSLRALMKDLEGISDKDIPGVEIPTGIPIVYDLDENLKPKGGKGKWLG